MTSALNAVRRPACPQDYDLQYSPSAANPLPSRPRRAPSVWHHRSKHFIATRGQNEADEIKASINGFITCYQIKMIVYWSKTSTCSQFFAPILRLAFKMEVYVYSQSAILCWFAHFFIDQNIITMVCFNFRRVWQTVIFFEQSQWTILVAIDIVAKIHYYEKFPLFLNIKRAISVICIIGPNFLVHSRYFKL